jgi:hypothetical protein
MKESIWQQIQMKTERLKTQHAAAFYIFHGHFDTSSARTNVTRVSATNNSIATSLIHHLGSSDKVGQLNERTTSWRFSDDCAIKSRNPANKLPLLSCMILSVIKSTLSRHPLVNAFYFTELFQPKLCVGWFVNTAICSQLWHAYQSL